MLGRDFWNHCLQDPWTVGYSSWQNLTLYLHPDTRMVRKALGPGLVGHMQRCTDPSWWRAAGKQDAGDELTIDQSRRRHRQIHTSWHGRYRLSKVWGLGVLRISPVKGLPLP